MPHSLTDRQAEYLEFLREYIRENQRSPRLDEIASNFGVKPPTAHKTLTALMHKGYLYFGRDSVSGFFIRLIDRAGSVERVIEVPIAGKFNRYGFVYDFPKKLGHFASVMIGSEPENIFALMASQDIPEASIDAGDLIICELERPPKPTEIAIFSWDQWLLIRSYSNTYDHDLKLMDLAIDYPMPEDLKQEDLHKWVNWTPLAYSEETHDYFMKYAEENGIPVMPITPNLIAATALKVYRQLAW